MSANRKSLKEMTPSIYALLAFITLVMLGGCLGTFGKLHWDSQVTSAFKAHDVQKDFNYYWYGVGNRTFAIAGISEDYHMESKMWREVQVNTQEFKDLISRAWYNDAYHPHEAKGAHILNPEGKQVGIWYSSLRFVAVKFSENNRIHLMPDTPFLGGPEADGTRPDSSQRLSAVESAPYSSYQLQALMTRR